MKTISAEELNSALSDLVVLEALPEKYFRDGHIPGARQIDYERVVEQAARLIPAGDSAVVVYCASSSCTNSHKAANSLTEHGYTNVRVFVGGKAEWVEKGYELRKIPEATV